VLLSFSTQFNPFAVYIIFIREFTFTLRMVGTSLIASYLLPLLILAFITAFIVRITAVDPTSLSKIGSGGRYIPRSVIRCFFPRLIKRLSSRNWLRKLTACSNVSFKEGVARTCVFEVLSWLSLIPCSRTRTFRVSSTRSPN
jgi:hypothetical protein